MELLLVEPAYPLNTLVSRFIYYSGYSGPSAAERLLPDGNTQIVLPLDDQPRKLLRNANSRDLNLSGGWVTGIQTAAVDYQSEVNATTLGIQLRPGGLARLCGHDSGEFKDWMIGIDLLPEAPLATLRDRLMGLPTGQAVIATAQSFLLNYVAETTRETRLIAFILQSLNRSGQSIESISRQAGYSHKHLIHQFKRALGVSPKTYQRILRFNTTLNALNSHKPDSYSDVAAINDYADQSHFIREFKHFSGFSPGQYLTEDRPYPHVVSL